MVSHDYKVVLILKRVDPRDIHTIPDQKEKVETKKGTEKEQQR
jgi:hypothetical protein